MARRAAASALSVLVCSSSTIASSRSLIRFEVRRCAFSKFSFDGRWALSHPPSQCSSSVPHSERDRARKDCEVDRSGLCGVFHTPADDLETTSVLQRQSPACSAGMRYRALPATSPGRHPTPPTRPPTPGGRARNIACCVGASVPFWRGSQGGSRTRSVRGRSDRSRPCAVVVVRLRAEPTVGRADDSALVPLALDSFGRRSAGVAVDLLQAKRAGAIYGD